MAQKNLALSVLLDCYGKCLTEKQFEVMDLYYNEDLSLAEIAEHSGITRQGVRDSIKRAEATMTELEEKLGVVAKAEEAERLLADITDVAMTIGRYNMSNIHSPELTKLVNRILTLSDRSDGE